MHLSFFNVERFKKQPLKTTFLVGINKIPLKLEFLSFYYYKRKGFKTPKKKKIKFQISNPDGMIIMQPFYIIIWG